MTRLAYLMRELRVDLGGGSSSKPARSWERPLSAREEAAYLDSIPTLDEDVDDG